MPEPDPLQPTTLLDACAVINLFATRLMGDILTVNDGHFAVVDLVVDEAKYVFRGGLGDDARERDPVALAAFFQDGILDLFSSNDEDELLTFFDLTLEIDDGEAMTAAIAIHRGCTVVTDDRKAQRVLQSRGVAIRSTLELIQHWEVHIQPPVERIRLALTELRQRGRYEPPHRHPLRPWWDDVLK